MLDPAKPTPVPLNDFTAYIAGCMAMAGERLAGYPTVGDVAEAEDDLNQYPRLDILEQPRNIVVMDDKIVTPNDIALAKDALLHGEVLLEHTCAGEATRLGMGPKYMINPARDLTYEVLQKLGVGRPAVKPLSLHDISLGRRHMLQLAWDLSLLAQEAGLPPSTVLRKQWLLIIAGENSADAILGDFQQANFYGFDPEKVLFMIQRGFHGMIKNGGWVYDSGSVKRLHNHGQMLMQTTMDGQIFTLTDGIRQSLNWDQYRSRLSLFRDKVSFNIEDLDYLGRSLDLHGLAMALKLSLEGYRMIMETVRNHPENPQKGGSLCWDPELGRNVMIESFQLKGVANQDIKFLNKNINHYPYPLETAKAVREKGLSMPIAVKDGYLYFQPVQGDVNFLVPTAFVQRAEPQPIKAWKSAANTEVALKAMQMQERRPGFLAWAEDITGCPLGKA